VFVSTGIQRHLHINNNEKHMGEVVPLQLPPTQGKRRPDDLTSPRGAALFVDGV
jgi:hypothetical protein